MTPRQPSDLPSHEPWEELAVGHALNSLEPEDDDAFLTHLPTCDACRRLVAEMSDVAAELAYAAEPADPPPAVWEGIAAAIMSSDRPMLPPSPGIRPDLSGRPEAAPERQPRAQADGPATSAPAPLGGPATSSTDPLGWAASSAPNPLGAPGDPARPPAEGERRRPAWLRSSALAVAAALVGIAGLGGVVLVGRFFQVRSDKAAAERQLSAVLNCAGRGDCSVVPMQPAASGTASAIALVEPGGVRMVVTNLAATDRDSSYVLWAAGPGKAVTGVGRFALERSGRQIVSADLAPSAGNLTGRGLAVTREPGRAIPRAPSTAPALQSKASSTTSSSTTSQRTTLQGTT